MFNYFSPCFAVSLVVCNLVVPFTCRTLEGMDMLVDFVRNNRYNNSLLQLLTSSLLSCDSDQSIRGYVKSGVDEEGQ